MRITSAVAFVAVVLATNAITSGLGIVTWAGVAVTAGTWLAGFSFIARDAVHESLGSRWVVGCIVVGAAVSATFSPALALASGVAFLLSELADLAVYQPMRRRGLIRAALASNLVGSVVDSVAFLLIAGFPLSLVWAQVGIKSTTTTVFVLLIWGCRALLREPVGATSGGRHA